jgi:hypothetical protein
MTNGAQTRDVNSLRSVDASMALSLVPGCS